VIYNWQNNRNPFIDLPDLIDYIWGDNFGDVWFNNLDISEYSNGLTFYPNPTKGSVSFKSELDKVEVFSLRGQKLLSYQNVRVLDLNLEKGLYLIRVFKGNKSSNLKIIIN